MCGSRKVAALCDRLLVQQAPGGLRPRKGETSIRTRPVRRKSDMDELHDKHVEIDERWLSEWFEFGFAELSSYLAKHAAFDDYCHRHELG